MKTAPDTTQLYIKPLIFLSKRYKKIILIGTLVLNALFFCSQLKKDSSTLKTDEYESAPNHFEVVFTSRYLRINDYLFHGKEDAEALA